MNRFEWSAPRTVVEAASSAMTTVADAMSGVQTDVSLVKAGGVDLLDLMKEGLVAPHRIVNLRNLPGLDTVVDDHGGGLRIGALITLAALGNHPLLRARYTALASAIESSGSPQLRNVATLGGNILQRPRCWYFRSVDFPCRRKGGAYCYALLGENEYHAILDNEICAIVHPSTAATALVALDAKVELTDVHGKVRQLRLEDFFVRPDRDVRRENDLRLGEILTAICLPPLPATARSVHLKHGEKAAFDWPLADVAVVLDLARDGICRRASIVLGAAAPVPYRAPIAEKILVGRVVNGDTAVAASHAALAAARPLAKNRYKLPIFAALVRRAILRAASEA